MIRSVKLTDAAAIATIYNEYILHSIITFETIPITPEVMQSRIDTLSKDFPYYVYEIDGKIAGYCYVHGWKSKAAYDNTVELTIYLSPEYKGQGIGSKLMKHLIDECRQRHYHCIVACITQGNEASFALHARFGFEQVSLFKEVGRKFDKWIVLLD